MGKRRRCHKLLLAKLVPRSIPSGTGSELEEMMRGAREEQHGVVTCEGIVRCALSLSVHGRSSIIKGGPGERIDRVSASNEGEKEAYLYALSAHCTYEGAVDGIRACR
jgi:hypothetical protein